MNSNKYVIYFDKNDNKSLVPYDEFFYIKEKQEYNKEYRNKNREKLNLNSKNHYNKNRQKLLEYHKKYYKKNKQILKVKHQKYYDDNRENYQLYYLVKKNLI